MVPRWMVRAAEQNAAAVSTLVHSVVLRPSRLAGRDAAREAVLGVLQPLDILATRIGGRLSGQLVPGYFTHVAIYLGTEPQLRAAGLWAHPALGPYRDDIRAGRFFVEAMPDRVRLASARDVFDSDAIAILRPSLSPGPQRAALDRALGDVGRPFDYVFDLRDATHISCTELLYRCMPGLHLPERVIYGRPVAVPDDVAVTALDGSGRTRLIGFVEGLPNGWAVRRPGILTARILNAWRVSRAGGW